MNQSIYAFRAVCERRFFILAVAFVVTLISAISAHAAEIVLSSPVNCTDAKCFIQRTPDQLLGSKYQNYQCRSFSSNGYKSTDIRVKRAAELVGKIPVTAVLDGVVDAVRDGMPDGIFTGDKAAFIKGKECGNGVYLRHKNGLKTQYCHLRKGSVKVKKGEKIKAGQQLAEMGLSGRTNFPHLEFRLIQNNKAVDPFNGKAVETGCDGRDNSLWKGGVLKGVDLATTHLVSAGFAGKVPTLPAVVLGLLDKEKMPDNLPAFVLWVEVAGIEKGDIEEFTITKPDGSIMLKNSSKPHGNGRALYLGYAGKKLSNPLKAGRYTGHYQLIRKQNGNNKVIISKKKSITIFATEE